MAWPQSHPWAWAVLPPGGQRGRVTPSPTVSSSAPASWGPGLLGSVGKRLSQALAGPWQPEAEGEVEAERGQSRAGVTPSTLRGSHGVAESAAEQHRHRDVAGLERGREQGLLLAAVWGVGVPLTPETSEAGTCLGPRGTSLIPSEIPAVFPFQSAWPVGEPVWGPGRLSALPVLEGQGLR